MNIEEHCELIYKLYKSGNYFIELIKNENNNKYHWDIFEKKIRVETIWNNIKEEFDCKNIYERNEIIYKINYGSLKIKGYKIEFNIDYYDDGYNDDYDDYYDDYNDYNQNIISYLQNLNCHFYYNENIISHIQIIHCNFLHDDYFYYNDKSNVISYMDPKFEIIDKIYNNYEIINFKEIDNNRELSFFKIDYFIIFLYKQFGYVSNIIIAMLIKIMKLKK